MSPAWLPDAINRPFMETAMAFTLLPSRDQHGYEKPAGFGPGLAGVGVRVGHSNPAKNPYPIWGWRVLDG